MRGDEGRPRVGEPAVAAVSTLGGHRGLAAELPQADVALVRAADGQLPGPPRVPGQLLHRAAVDRQRKQLRICIHATRRFKMRR